MREYNEDILRDYLLGKHPEEALDAMDIAIARDAALTDDLRGVECDLIDEFLANKLSPADAGFFERNYLVSDARLAGVRTIEAIRAAARENATSKGAMGTMAGSRFRESGRLVWTSAALAGLLLVGGVAMYVLSLDVKRDDVAVVLEPEPKPAVVPSQKPIVEPPAPTPVVTESVKTMSPKSEPSVRPEPVKPKAETASMSVRLTAGADRSSGEQSVTIPPNVKSLTFFMQAAEEFSKYRRFHAVLKTPEDETVYEGSGLSSPRFTIDASKLENRTYVVSLGGEKKKREVDSLADYTFRVRR